MGDFVADVFPGLGLTLTKKQIRVRNATAAPLVFGDVTMFVHFGGTAPGITNFAVGDPASTLVAVRGPGVASAVDGYALACVIAEFIAVNEFGAAWLWHPRVRARVDGATIYGQPLGCTQTNDALSLDVTPLGGAKVLAIAQEIVAGAGLCWVTFDGFHGFGKGGP
jgi:hypothetical protein